jgi:ABC-2 type transport system ATP-binding protein
MHSPAVLLLDEPSTGLDPAARRALGELFARLAGEGVAVFLTTHLMEEAEPCHAVAIIDRGRLVAMDSPEALCRSIGGDVITFEVDSPDALARHIGPAAFIADGAVRVEHDAGHRFAAEVIESYPGRVHAVHVGRPTLADVFVQATGHTLENADVSSEVAVLSKSGA